MANFIIQPSEYSINSFGAFPDNEVTSVVIPERKVEIVPATLHEAQQQTQMRATVTRRTRTWNRPFIGSERTRSIIEWQMLHTLPDHIDIAINNVDPVMDNTITTSVTLVAGAIHEFYTRNYSGGTGIFENALNTKYRAIAVNAYNWSGTVPSVGTTVNVAMGQAPFNAQGRLYDESAFDDSTLETNISARTTITRTGANLAIRLDRFSTATWDGRQEVDHSTTQNPFGDAYFLISTFYRIPQQIRVRVSSDRADKEYIIEIASPNMPNQVRYKENSLLTTTTTIDGKPAAQYISDWIIARGEPKKYIDLNYTGSQLLRAGQKFRVSDINGNIVETFRIHRVETSGAINPSQRIYGIETVD